MNNFLAFIKIKNYSEHTLINYRIDLEQFVEFMQKRRLTDWKQVGISEIRAYLAYLTSLGLARASILRKIASLRSFFKYLTLQGVVENNPFIIFRAPKRQKKLPQFLYAREIDKLLSFEDNSAKG